MPNAIENSPGQQQPVRKRRLRRWFVAGFVIVFLVLALAVNMYPWNLRGDAIVRCKLWEYYTIEIERAFSSSKAMGPTSGSSSRAITTAALHLLVSATGGAVALGIGWVYHRVKGR